MDDMEVEVVNEDEYRTELAEDLEAGMWIDLSGDKYADPVNEGCFDDHHTRVSEIRFQEIDNEELVIAECVYNHEWFTVYFPLEHKVSVFSGSVA